MELSVVIPVYDDPEEAAGMVEAVRKSLVQPLELEFLLMDLADHRRLTLPAAKNEAALVCEGEFLFFLYPGIFPTPGSIETLLACLRRHPEIGAVCGRWSNAKGNLEVGYNVRRFPTFTALVFDILLINKLFPSNSSTRRYKMHDFDHKSAVRVEHANDCVFMVRREAVLHLGGFQEKYAPGWFDQVEFCQALNRAGGQIFYEPRAEFISNERPPLIDRLVRDHYAQYRRAERRYIAGHFGRAALWVARFALVLGMLERMAFSFTLPALARKWFLSRLRSYVDDAYIRSLRRTYWSVLKETFMGER